MRHDGNHVLIPNSIIYKRIIAIYTTIPIARFESVGWIGYEDLIIVALEVL
jgi:hypothetical protein